MASQDFFNLELDSILYLYIFDITSSTPDDTPTFLYLTDQLDTDRSNISYNGKEYTAVSITSEGFEVSSSGSMPRPSTAVSNVGGTYNQVLLSYNDLLSAKVTRYKVFYKYLDGKPQGGIGAYASKDSWLINKKAQHNNAFIKWELKSPLDLETLMLPKGQVTRKCSHSYRRYVSGQFLYGSCPYAGTHYFDDQGNATSINNDVCGKTVRSCSIRFLADNPTNNVPIRAFPLIPNI